jgi:PAS domain-containing protein
MPAHAPRHVIASRTVLLTKNLHESVEWLRATFDAMLEGCQIIGRDWRYQYLNDVAIRQGRRPREALLGHTMMEAYPGIEQTDLFVVLRRCMDERIPERLENEFVFPDGTTGWFELSIHPVPAGIFILSLDVTERERAGEEARRLNRALQVLSDCNQTLVRAADEDTLLCDICRIIVNIGGYHLAWVGQAEEDEEKSVRPMAQAGVEPGDLDAIRLTWADTAPGQILPASLSARAGIL